MIAPARGAFAALPVSDFADVAVSSALSLSRIDDSTSAKGRYLFDEGGGTAAWLLGGAG